MKEFFQLIRSASCGVLALFLFGWIIVRIRTLDPQFGGQLVSSAEWPGVLMMILGAILMSICVATFGFWGGGTPSLLAPTKRLVVIGPYRYVRNPIHIGQVLFFLGLGLFLRSPAVLLFSSAWLLFCHLYVVLIEERSLKKKFGAPYEEYCKAVARWIPLSFHHKVC